MDIPCFVLSFCQLIFELFLLLAIMDNVAMNNHVRVFVGTYIFIFLGVYLRVGLLSHMVTLGLRFGGAIKHFSQVSTPLHIYLGIKLLGHTVTMF